MSETITVIIEEDFAGHRLDKVLAELVPDLSRVKIQGLIADGSVRSGGAVVSTASRKVVANEAYDIDLPEAEPDAPMAEDIPLDILYEDDDLMVINKPAGLVVHPGSGNADGTLVNALLHHCGDNLSTIGGVWRPGIVHRLDKDTSGLMLVAKNDETHEALSQDLQDRIIKRTYIAFCLNIPVPLKGRIDRAIERHPTNRLKMALSRSGKVAITDYVVEENYGTRFAAVVCNLQTGRTHQIRVHMSSINSPVVGDPLYGAQKNAVQAALREAPQDVQDAIVNFPRQALHARELGFVHPATGEEMHFECPLPEDIVNLQQQLRTL